MIAVLPFLAGTASAQPHHPVWLNVETPVPAATVRAPFLVGGWAFDASATLNSGISWIDLWAYPASGAAPVYVGSATLGVSRPDVAAAYGAQYALSGFYAVITTELPPGDYNLAVFPFRTATQQFVAATVVPITVRGVTLSDLTCTAGQVPSWDGTAWGCIDGTGPPGPTGATGPAGPAGATGASGPAGATGLTGETGPAGAAGPIGATGAIGATGSVGPAGINGDVGPAGPTGLTGEPGPAGTPGVAGATGPAGPLGPIGATGAVGATGPAGPLGPIGATGAVGATGPAGPLGPIGATGAAGATGPAGPLGPIGATGAVGATGPAGPLGPIGATGAAGATGPAGPLGPIGATGAAGATGPAGPLGPIGATGAAGATGPAGPLGPIGADGATGGTGPAGPAGVTGATGSAGPAGATGPIGPEGPPLVAEFAYIYNVNAQVVVLEADVAFDTNGVISSNITHNPGTTGIVLALAGIYDLAFSMSVVEPNQFAFFLNGVPVAGSIYGSGAGAQQNKGQVIVVVAAGDVLTLRNHTSASPVTLQTLAGGTESNVNASILIRKLD